MNDRVGQQIGKYQVSRLLGRGGFAEVYLGEHIYLKTQAALKFLHGRFSEQDVQDFMLEAKTIAALKHPHIVRVYDFGLEQQMPYIVMDYAPNGTLHDRHPRGTVVPLPQILSYVKQVGAALAYTHEHKLIHRDVKPENMLLDERNQVQLSDFGIAAIAHRTASIQLQSITGTVRYMAPEQFLGYPTPASDQYSLGILVYEWLCGVCPFQGTNFIEMGMKHATEPVPSLRQKVPTLLPEVEQVVLKALAKDEKHRFFHIQDFVQALEQAAQPPGSTTTVSVEREQQTVIEQAEQLLQGGRHRAAGAIAGVILETHLKKLCDQHNIPYPDRKGLQALIQALQHKGIISVGEARRLTHLASIRNKCDHASPVSEQEVRLLVEEVKKFADWVDGAKGGKYPSQTVITQGAAKPIQEKPVRDSNGGCAEVLQTFQASKGSVIAGCRVRDGKIMHLSLVGVWREQQEIYQGKVISLRRGKNDVREVESGNICGVMLENFNEYQVGDILEFISREEDSEANIPNVSPVKTISPPEIIHPNIPPTRRGSQRVGTTIATYHFTTLGERQPDTHFLAWSPDGTKLAASGQTVTIWDTFTGKELFHTPIESKSVAWSPNSAYLVAAGSRSHSPFIYDTRTNQQTVNLQNVKLEKHIEERATSIEEVVWLPDSTHLLSLMGNNQTVTLWNGPSGEPRNVYHVIRKEMYPRGEYLTLSPDGECFSLVFDTTLRTWSTRTGQLIRTFDHAGTTKRASAWSPDGKYIATYDARQTGHIWDVATGKSIQTWQGGNGSTLAWSPDARYIAVAGGNANVTIWEALTGRKVYVYRGHEREVGAVAWSPDGSRIASGAKKERCVHIWQAPEVPLEVIPSPISTFSLADVPIGVKDEEEEKEVMVSSGVQSLTERLRLKTPSQKTETLLAMYQFETLEENIVPETHLLAWSRDGKKLASGGKTITLWDTVTGKEYFHEKYLASSASLAWSPDCQYLATGDDTVCVYNVITKQQVAQCDPAKLSPVTKLLYQIKQPTSLRAKYVNWLPDKDHKRVMVLADSQFVMIWDVFASKVLKTYKLRIPDEYYPSGDKLIISPDGKYFSVTLDTRPSIWSTETGELIRVLERAGTSIRAHTWSPVGRHIAAYNADNEGCMWEVPTGKCVQKWQHHSLSLSECTLAWSPDARYIAVAGGNANVTIWEALTGRKVYVYRGHEREVGAVAWSPDGSRIASGAKKERCVHIWQAPI